MIRILASIEKKDHEKLKAISAKTGIPMSRIIRNALSDYLKKEFDHNKRGGK